MINRRTLAALAALIVLAVAGVFLYKAPQPVLNAAPAARVESFGGIPPQLRVGALRAPRGVAVGASQAIHIVDGGALRMLGADGALGTLAGQVGARGYRDGAGAVAQFNSPQGIAVGPDGTVYVADSGNHAIRTVSPAGVAATLAGHAGHAGKADGTARQARFNRPTGVALDGKGNVLVADHGNGALRIVSPDGSVRTLAARLPVPPRDGRPAYAMQPHGVAVAPQGTVLVNDEQAVLMLHAGGGVELLPPPAPAAHAADNCERGKCLRRLHAPPLAAGDGQPGEQRFAIGVAAGVADGAGSLVAASPDTRGIYRIDHDGTITPLLGAYAIDASFSGMAADAQGRVTAMLMQGGYETRWDAAGKASALPLQLGRSANRDGPLAQARFDDPVRIAVGRDGNVYVLDGDQLRRIDRNDKVTTLLQQGGFKPLGGAGAVAAQVDWHGSMVARPSTGVFVTANGTLAGISSEGHIGFISGPPGMTPEETGLAAALRRIWAYASGEAEPFILPGIGRHRIAADATGQAYYCVDGTLWRIRPRGAARMIALRGSDGCGNVMVAPDDDVLMLHGTYITRVGSDGHQMLVAGSRELGGQRDGAGLLARFTRITGAAFHPDGSLYLLDNGAIRRLGHDGTVATRMKVDADFAAIAVDRKGTLWLAGGRRIARIHGQ